VELYAKAAAAVISTPIPHAVESLGKRNGILLNSFDNPDEFKAILYLIENEEQRIVRGKMLFYGHATNQKIQYRLYLTN
jgi:hypothetical protein